MLRHKSHSRANWSLTKFKTVEGAAMGWLMQGRSGKDDAPVNRTMPKRADMFLKGRESCLLYPARFSMIVSFCGSKSTH